MSDIIGTLGEPLDFGERYLEDENDAAEHEANADADRQDAAGTFRVVGAADLEAAGPSVSGSVDSVVLDIDGIELEVRSNSAHARH